MFLTVYDISSYFNVSFMGLFNFLFGVFLGFLLFSLIYMFLLIRGQRIDLNKIKLSDVEINNEELKDIIKNKQRKFGKHKSLKSDNSAKLAFDMSYELINDISRYYYPKSKYPMMELSIDEILRLSNYITKRVDDLLDKPVIKNVKKINIVKIAQVINAKNKIDDNVIVKNTRKFTKKYHLGKVVNSGAMIINVANPAYWFRKLVINPSIDAITKRIYVIVIGIVGEETNKIYSKKLFQKDVDLKIVEKDIEKLMMNIGDDSNKKTK